jgi:NAD(P)-dependent dehydrogenase (short-subunit alcohol dehydrogenase family)
VLHGKTIIVTGGAGRLGQAFCHAIAANAGHVVIADKENERAQRLSAELNKTYANSASAEHIEITSATSVDTLVESVLARRGAIDALVNNAYPRNHQYGREFFEVSYEDFCENLNLHLGGYFLCSQRFASLFRRQGFGTILNVASIYGVVAPRFEVYQGTTMTMPVEYAAIKAGIIHLTKYMASYLAGSNVRVNCISPGGILAEQPQSFIHAYNEHCCSKGMLDAEDLTGTLIFLLSDASAAINGQNIIVDDGFTL